MFNALPNSIVIENPTQRSKGFGDSPVLSDQGVLQMKEQLLGDDRKKGDASYTMETV
jgi:hypothetical protein